MALPPMAMKCILILIKKGKDNGYGKCSGSRNME